MIKEDFFRKYTYDVRKDKIGGGAFGTVYKAYDNDLDKYVAIKVSEVRIIADREFSLVDDFEVLKGLSGHKNIANYERLFTFTQPNVQPS